MMKGGNMKSDLIAELERVGISVVKEREYGDGFVADVEWKKFRESDYKEVDLFFDDWSISCFVNDKYKINIILLLNSSFYCVDIFEKEEA